MKVVAASILATGILQAPACGALTSPKLWLQLVLVVDSVWGHSELTVFIDEHDQGTADLQWRDEGGVGGAKGSAKLVAQEVKQFRRLADESQPTSGQFCGKDHRGLDAPLITLSIGTEGERIAVLVATGNPSFEKGPRKELLERLLALGERIRKSK